MTIFALDKNSNLIGENDQLHIEGDRSHDAVVLSIDSNSITIKDYNVKKTSPLFDSPIQKFSFRSFYSSNWILKFRSADRQYLGDIQRVLDFGAGSGISPIGAINLCLKCKRIVEFYTGLHNCVYKDMDEIYRLLYPEQYKTSSQVSSVSSINLLATDPKKVRKAEEEKKRKEYDKKHPLHKDINQDISKLSIDDIEDATKNKPKEKNSLADSFKTKYNTFNKK